MEAVNLIGRVGENWKVERPTSPTSVKSLNLVGPVHTTQMYFMI